MHKHLKDAINAQTKRLPGGVVKDRPCGGVTFERDGFITYFDKYGKIEAHLYA